MRIVFGGSIGAEIDNMHIGRCNRNDERCIIIVRYIRHLCDIVYQKNNYNIM